MLDTGENVKKVLKKGVLRKCVDFVSESFISAKFLQTFYTRLARFFFLEKTKINLAIS